MSFFKKSIVFCLMFLTIGMIFSSISFDVDAAVEDQYENNNSVSTAFNLSDTIPEDRTSWTKYIYANIRKYTIFTGKDQDYFMFYVYGDGSLNVNLSNIPTGENYNIELYKHDDYKYVSSDDYSLVTYSRLSSNLVENINIDVTPGTYYVRVYPNSNSDWSNDYNYRLKISYVMQNQNASIQDLRNRNAKAAVWVSDYKPFNLSAVDSTGVETVATYSGYYNTGYLSVRHGNTFHQKIAEFSPIVYTTLYVWDLEWRRELHSLLTEMGIFVQNQIATMKQIQAGVEFVSGSLSFVLKAIDTFGITKTLTIKITEYISEGIAALIPTIFPASWYASKSEVLTYIASLASAFEADENTSDDEVVMMRLRYQLSITEAYAGSRSYIRTYKLSFVPNFQFENNLYSTDIINHYQTEGKMSGNVYGLREFADLVSFINGTPVTNLPLVTSGGSSGGSSGGPGGNVFELAEMN